MNSQSNHDSTYTIDIDRNDTIDDIYTEISYSIIPNVVIEEIERMEIALKRKNLASKYYKRLAEAGKLGFLDIEAIIRKMENRNTANIDKMTIAHVAMTLMRYFNQHHITKLD